MCSVKLYHFRHGNRYGLPIYHIDRQIKEINKAFETHIIYVNSRKQDDTELGRLMHDLHCKRADELFRRLQASQFVAEHRDQVCPAKWQPGAETLKPSLDLVGML